MAQLERRPVVALFMDVSGYTAMVEDADPEDVRALLKEPFALAAAAVRRRGGRIEKYIGDAIFAVFGADRSHRDDVDRAVLTALEVRRTLQGLPSPLDLHAGIEIGEVLVDMLSTAGAADLAVVGDAVNVAARLLGAARTGDILLGPEAARLTSAQIGSPSAVELKGKKAPLQVVTVTGPPQGLEPATPFRGREQELRAMLERPSGFVKLTGQPGSGKSRLALEAASLTSLPVLRTECPAPGEGTAADVLRPLVDDGAAEVVRATAGLGSMHGEFSTLMGTGRTGQAKTAWREHFARLAGADGLVLIVDDAHWCPEDARELIKECEGLVILCGWDAAGLEAWPGEAIEVRPLEPAAARLVATDAGIPPERLDAVIAAAAGNPLYVISVSEAAAGSALPLGVRGAVTARLDELGSELRRAAQGASVIAASVVPGCLASLLSVDQDSAADTCLALAGRGVLQRRGDNYAFSHGLLSETAYASISRDDRIAMHRAAAAWISGEAGEPALIAHHLERCGERLDAQRLYRAAATKALSRLAPSESAAHLDRALALAEDGETRAAILIDKGHALFAAGRGPEAITAFSEAEAGAPPELQARALLGRAVTSFWASQVEDAENLVERALGVASAPAVKAEAQLVHALVRSSQGKSADASRLVDDACRAADELGMGALAAMGGAVSVTVHHHSGRSRHAVDVLDEVAAHCQAEGLPDALVWAMFKGGCAHAALGNFESALRCWDEVDRIVAATGSLAWTCYTSNCRAHVVRELGGGARADELDHRSLEIGARFSDSEGQANALLNLAAGAIAAGDLDGAEVFLTRAQPQLDAFAFYRWRYTQRFRHYRALLDMAAGNIDQARQVTDESLAIGRGTGEGKNTLRPLLVLASIDGSLEAFRTVAADAERLGLLPIAWRARAAAADLGDDESHRMAVAHLSALAATAPSHLRDDFVANVAAPVENRDYASWRLPL